MKPCGRDISPTAVVLDSFRGVCPVRFWAGLLPARKLHKLGSGLWKVAGILEGLS